MAGTIAGGKNARDTLYKKYGKDHYRLMGAKGGRISRGGGFTNNRELARIAGSKGGKVSRRGKAVPSADEVNEYTKTKHSFLRRMGDRLHG